MDGTRTCDEPRKRAGFAGSAQGEGANGRESSPFAPIQNPLTQGELEAAIATVTRALATASGDAVVILAGERAALRAELARATEPTSRGRPARLHAWCRGRSIPIVGRGSFHAQALACSLGLLAPLVGGCESKSTGNGAPGSGAPNQDAGERDVWSPTDAPATPDTLSVDEVYAVDAPSDDGGTFDASAAGSDGGPSTSALMPRSWEFVGGPTLAVAISGSGPSDVWVVDTTFVYHYDGQTWKTYSVNVAGQISGVWASGPSDAYASVMANVALHWDGTQWTKQFGNIQQGSEFNSVWGSGPSDVYLAGLMHSTGGGNWTDASVPAEQVDFGGYPAMWGTGPNDFWFAGGYTTLRRKNPVGVRGHRFCRVSQRGRHLVRAGVQCGVRRDRQGRLPGSMS